MKITSVILEHLQVAVVTLVTMSLYGCSTVRHVIPGGEHTATPIAGAFQAAQAPPSSLSGWDGSPPASAVVSAPVASDEPALARGSVSTSIHSLPLAESSQQSSCQTVSVAPPAWTLSPDEIGLTAPPSLPIQAQGALASMPLPALKPPAADLVGSDQPQVASATNLIQISPLGDASCLGSQLREPADEAETQEDWAAVLNEARMALARGATAEAQDQLTTLIACDEDPRRRVEAQYWLGETYFQQEQYAFALKEYHECRNVLGDNLRPDALYKICLCQLHLGDNKTAQQTFGELQTVYPDSDQVKWARQRLARLQPAAAA
jgi:TolA-binding protein